MADDGGFAKAPPTEDVFPGITALIEEAAAAAEPQSDYFISITRVGSKASFRRLHLLSSNCPNKPRAGLSNYEWAASPGATHYDAVCRRCWPQGELEGVVADEAGGGSNTSGSEEPSSADEAAVAKDQ